jgi:hypothetical protein
VYHACIDKRILIGYKFCVRLINEKTIYFSLKYTEINKKKLRKSREKITSMQPNVQLTPGNKSNSLINSPILIIPTNPTPLLPNYPSLSLSLSLSQTSPHPPSLSNFLSRRRRRIQSQSLNRCCFNRTGKPRIRSGSEKSLL